MSAASQLSVALALAADGLRVFPITTLQKFPPPKGWQELATMNPEQITRWYTADDFLTSVPNIGITTGNGLLVIDLDPRNGSDASFAALEKNHGLFPSTRTVLTPSGGRHYYFKVPPQLHVSNNNRGKLGKGIDIKGDGGYVVAPGSVTDKGPYRWEDSQMPTVDAPAWLLELATKPHVPKESNNSAARSTSAIPKHNLTLADARAILEHLIAERDDYESWFEVLVSLRRMAKGAQDSSTESDYLALADEWSRGSQKYEGRADVEAKWRETDTREYGYGVGHLIELARAAGWHPPARASDVSAFAPVAADPGNLKPPVPPPTKIDQVAPAYLLNTDQANAWRLVAHFGKQLVASGGSFYIYTGIHWERDDSEATRYGSKLAEIVRAEAKAARAKFESLAAENLDGKKLEATIRRDKSHLEDNLRASHPEMVEALYKAELLEKWQKSCEMRTNQKNALEMLRDWLQIDPAKFDQNPALLNCLNGTVNLRTGELRPHDPTDYITRCAPVRYNPDAKAPRFEQFLVEILDEERAKFLQRWFGYGLSGETGEQKMLVHIGEGGNGKGTLLELVENVTGEYSHTAPRGLLTAFHGDDRHPTEIAGLFGRRLVTAHESEDGAILREGFVKQATGEDRLTGRYMHKDFFSFRPTHKLQLLTNHKPTIKGSDYGIWRRLLLVQYDVKFGSEEDVKTGKAMHVRDATLKTALLAEREGIFNWLVRGAIDWYRDGLRPPASVLEAGEAYRLEQDRVGQFVNECCILDAAAWSPFSGTFGLYPAYSLWCRSSGYQPLGKKRFIDELPRLVPKFRKAQQKRTDNGPRKTVDGVYGVSVAGDFGGIPFTPLADPLIAMPVQVGNGEELR